MIKRSVCLASVMGQREKKSGMTVKLNLPSIEFLWGKNKMAGRNDFEERRQGRIDRLHERSDNAAKKAGAHFRRSEEASRPFEDGQPILVGHHSESKMRAQQKKVHSAMGQMVKEGEKAAYYAGKAKAAENNTAIFSDDPDAPDKLEAKIAALEKKQSDMKAVNAYWRKNKTMKGYGNMSDESAAMINEQMKTAYSWIQKNGPYESFELTNNLAVIKNIKMRLEKLEKVENMADETISFEGGKIISDSTTNRIIIFHDEKPAPEVIAKLKSNGFRWSPSVKGWQRLRSPGSLYLAKKICGK